MTTKGQKPTKPRIIIDHPVEQNELAPTEKKTSAPSKHLSPAARSGFPNLRLTSDLSKEIREWVTLVLLFIACITGYQTYVSTVDTSRKQLQAYVGIDTPVLSMPDLNIPGYKPEKIEAGSLIRNNILVKFHNFGQTPAHQLRYRLSWVSMPYGWAIPNDFNYADHALNLPAGLQENPLCTMIYPGQEIVSPTPVPDLTPFLSAKAKKTSLYCYGHVDFTDINEQPWRTNFCYVYHPEADANSTFIPYSEHNATEKI